MIPFNKYAVRVLKPLPEYKLEVTFTNGVTKIVDIGKLLGDDKRAGAVWNDFKNVKHREHYIYWGKGLQQYEFETRELWREGKPLPVGETVLDAPEAVVDPTPAARGYSDSQASDGCGRAIGRVVKRTAVGRADGEDGG